MGTVSQYWAGIYSPFFAVKVYIPLISLTGMQEEEIMGRRRKIQNMDIPKVGIRLLTQADELTEDEKKKQKEGWDLLKTETGITLAFPPMSKESLANRQNMIRLMADMMLKYGRKALAKIEAEEAEHLKEQGSE